MTRPAGPDGSTGTPGAATPSPEAATPPGPSEGTGPWAAPDHGTPHQGAPNQGAPSQGGAPAQPAQGRGAAGAAGRLVGGPPAHATGAVLPGAPPSAPPGGYPPRPRPTAGSVLRGLASEARVMVLLIVSGALVAALWRALAPEVADSGNALETAAAVDGTLAGLSVLAGVLTGAAVLARPGPVPVRRAVVAIVFSVLAGVVSWQVGDLLGTPPLRATGVALIWPIVTSAVLFVGSLLPGTSRKLEGR